MKTISIGDLHGKDCWKKINVKFYDKIIFLGDYTDAWPDDKTDKEILENLADLIQFKKDNPLKVILLLGNHDIQYIFLGKYSCSGFRKSMAPSLKFLFEDNIDLFQYAFQIKNYLWTHAGISKKWWLNYGKPFATNDFTDYADAIECLVNVNQYREDLFEVGSIRGGYSGNYGGILWADKTEIRANYPFDENIHQIVGHTPNKKIETINKFQDKVFQNASVTFTDCLDTLLNTNNFYILNI